MISLIIPFHNAMPYFGDLLGSIRQQENNVAGLKLIFVNDRSMDSCSTVLNDFVLATSLEVTILNSESEGPGFARNLGISVVSTEYFAFCDADDLIDLMKLLALTKVMATSGIDLGVFDYYRLYNSGEKKCNSKSQMLASISGLNSDNESRLQLLCNFNVCWNKIYRTNFIKSNEVSFPVGIYEDVAWSIQTIFFANSILISTDAIYQYRQHRRSTLKNKGLSHAVLIKQYQYAIDRLNASSKLSKVILLSIVERAISHAFLVAYERSRLDFHARGKLFADLNEFIKVNYRYVNLFFLKISFEYKLTLILKSRFPAEFVRIYDRFLNRN